MNIAMILYYIKLYFNGIDVTWPNKAEQTKRNIFNVIQHATHPKFFNENGSPIKYLVGYPLV